MKDHVSIIIPTFNRSSLIGATLDSILRQTYPHWECNVVDDGSSDYTMELMGFYCSLDSRINYFQRPLSYSKGANSCRNYGFLRSKGDLIQWFDSDDLMLPHFLKTKIKALQENNADYVISKTANFKDPDPRDIISRNKRYYRFEQFAINNFNYVTQKVNWLTPDFLGKREVCQNLHFNVNLPSSQEYNFFCKLTYFSTNCVVLDEYLTLRRVHRESIQNQLVKKGLKELEKKIMVKETWKELLALEPNSKSEIFFRLGLLDYISISTPEFKLQYEMLKAMWSQKKLKSLFCMFLYMNIYGYTRRGYFLRKWI